jgi:hypothetical protein
MVKRARNFVEKAISLQEKFAMDIDKAASVERVKLHRMKEQDRMASSKMAWMGFFERIETTVQYHNQCALDLRTQVVEPLDKLHAQALAQGHEAKVLFSLVSCQNYVSIFD